MKTFEIEVEHTVVYKHILTVECKNIQQIEDVNEGLIDATNLDDVISSLEHKKIKVNEYIEDNNIECEIGIVDIMEI